MMNKKTRYFLVISLSCFLIFGIQFVFAENYSDTLRKMIENYNGLENEELDVNGDGIVDISDITRKSNDMGHIDISHVLLNYHSIIDKEEKSEFETLGFDFIADKCFIVDEEGLDLFAYVDGAEGLVLEILEGDNSFYIDNDYLYLKPDMAPTIARVRLSNQYAVSDEFVLYGTYDKGLHNYTFDYLIKQLKEQGGQ